MVNNDRLPWHLTIGVLTSTILHCVKKHSCMNEHSSSVTSSSTESNLLETVWKVTNYTVSTSTVSLSKIRMNYLVASLGLVSPEAATEGVTLFFS